MMIVYRGQLMQLNDDGTITPFDKCAEITAWFSLDHYEAEYLKALYAEEAAERRTLLNSGPSLYHQLLYRAATNRRIEAATTLNAAYRHYGIKYQEVSTK